MVVGVIFLPLSLFGGDLEWQNVNPTFCEVKDILISKANPEVIYVSTNIGVYKSKDIKNWQLILKVKDALFIREDKYGFLYTANKSELYFSEDQGLNWKKVYKSRNSQEELQDLAITLQDYLYLATQTGVVFSSDKGRTWQKIDGILGHLCIKKIIYDAHLNILYLLTDRGVYRLRPQSSFLERIFIKGIYEDEIETGSEDDNENIYRIKDIKTDNRGNLYIATDKGVMLSNNMGDNWQALTDNGLLKEDIYLLYINNNFLYAINSSGVFLYQKEKWEEITLRLMPLYIYAMAQDVKGNIYLAANKGLFKSAHPIHNNYSYHCCSQDDLEALFKDEPDILEVQKKAIAYAGIVDKAQIERHQVLARLKALLPNLNLDYDKTITYYSNTNSTRFAEGPLDWGISLTWNLGDLVWSEQQRLIDSQTRLLIELRNDLLEQVDKLYFERLRLKRELLYEELSDKMRAEKILKLKEITASLDGLTEGFFSSALKKK